MRAKSNRVREGNGDGFKKEEEEKGFCFVVVEFEIFGHRCFYVVCACNEFFGEVGHFAERRGFPEWLEMIPERGVVYKTKRTGTSTEL